MAQSQKVAERLRTMAPAITSTEEQLTQPPAWTAAELRAAIGRCEDEVARLVAEHARPEAIYSRRQGIDVLYVLLREAERGERHGPAGGSEWAYGCDERSHVLRPDYQNDRCERPIHLLLQNAGQPVQRHHDAD